MSPLSRPRWSRSRPPPLLLSSPTTLELLRRADRELIYLPHLSPAPRALVERLLRLLPAAHGEAVRLGLLAGALSTESVSERQGERACACARGGKTNRTEAQLERERGPRESRITCLKASLPTSASGLHQQMQCVPSAPPPAHHSLPVPALARRRVVVCRPQLAASASE